MKRSSMTMILFLAVLAIALFMLIPFSYWYSFTPVSGTPITPIPVYRSVSCILTGFADSYSQLSNFRFGCSRPLRYSSGTITA